MSKHHGSTLVEVATSSEDPLTARMEQMLADLAAAVDDAGPTTDAVRIDRIAALERLRAATAAAQAAECVRFAQSQSAEQLARDVHPKVIGRGIADQIALACHLCPTSGSHRLAVARALWFDLPGTLRALSAGRLSERIAEIVVAETRHLDKASRSAVDEQLIATGITEMGERTAAACVRRHAYRADPDGFVHRGRTERGNRRVELITGQTRVADVESRFTC
jgi:hypothetical protein